MLRVTSRKQQHLFDPWQFLSPKRRNMLDQSWPGFFREHILDLLPVERLALLFPGQFGRPTKKLYTVLGALALQQCDVQPDGSIELKAPKQIGSDSLQNPSDPDASYSGHKGQGYQVQVMETYTEHEAEGKDAGQLNLITCVEVEKACQSDAQALLPALETTLEKDLAPELVQTDALYGSDENCQQAAQLNVEVISPAMGTEKRNGGNLSDFQCQRERTEQFRQKYRWRAGVKATMSQYDRLAGVKRLRVRGLKAVRFAAVMKATAINVARAVAAKRARLRAPGANSGQGCAFNRLFSTFKKQLGGLFRSLTGWAAGKFTKRTCAHNLA